MELYSAARETGPPNPCWVVDFEQEKRTLTNAGTHDAAEGRRWYRWCTRGLLSSCLCHETVAAGFALVDRITYLRR